MSARDAYLGGIAVALLVLAAFVVLWALNPGMARGALVATYWPLSVVFVLSTALATIARFAGGDQ